MFEWLKDFGSKVPIIMELPIPAATVIEKGEMVGFTPGIGVIALGADGVDFDGPAIGVAVNGHAANSGVKIEVYVSTTAVYRHKCRNVITATGGSATTFVVATLVPATNDVFNDGYLEIVTCAADPSLVGEKIRITDHTGAGGTLTFDAQPAAFAAGDTAYLCPGPLAIKTTCWNLDAHGMNVDFAQNATVGESLVLLNADPEQMNADFMIRLHAFGNGPAAL